MNDWVKFNIGGAQQAQALFTRADTNDDLVIDSKDIPAIFAFFDQNGKMELLKLESVYFICSEQQAPISLRRWAPLLFA